MYLYLYLYTTIRHTMKWEREQFEGPVMVWKTSPVQYIILTLYVVHIIASIMEKLLRVICFMFHVQSYTTSVQYMLT